MEICPICLDPLITHGSCCSKSVTVVKHGEGYYWPEGDYRIINGKIFRVISSNTKSLEEFKNGIR